MKKQQDNTLSFDTFSEFVRYFVSNNESSLRVLAGTAGLKISTIHGWMLDGKIPSVSNLERFVKALGHTLTWYDRIKKGDGFYDGAKSRSDSGRRHRSSVAAGVGQSGNDKPEIVGVQQADLDEIFSF